MLAGIFKTSDEAECDCCVLQLVDRIWLAPDGSASVIRDTIFEVDQCSPVPLSKVREIVPVSTVEDVRDLSSTLYMRDFYLNQRSRVNVFSVTRKPHPIESDIVDDVLEATISQYEFEGIAVFSSVPTEAMPYADAVMLECRFPRPIEPGERTMVRTSFVLPDQLLGDGVADCQHFGPRYFSARLGQKALEQVDPSRTQIPVKLEYGETKCGLDVAVFVPPSLHVNSPNPRPFDQRPDKTGFQGITDIFFTRYLWHARDFWTVELEPLITPLGIDCSEICPPDSTAHKVQELQAQVTGIDGRLGRLHSSSRLGTSLAVVGIVLSAVALLFSLNSCKAGPSLPAGNNSSRANGVSATGTTPP